MTNPSPFYFEKTSFNREKKKLTLYYSLGKEVSFEESFTFHLPLAKNIDEEVLKRSIYNLFIMTGISYWKTTLSPKIVLEEGFLTQDQAEFFRHVWKQGLGEFFYTNDIDPVEPNFPTTKANQEKYISQTEYTGTILPMGGGKDSLVTATLLKDEDKYGDIHTLTVGNYNFIKKQSEKLGYHHWWIERKISPELIRLNKEGALNGHIPISALWASLFVVVAALTNKKYVALSNEASANTGNTHWKGMDINHQYSKSLDFEEQFQNHIEQNICSKINYLSYLRPYKEIEIAKIFSEKCWNDFKHDFTSCNRNFHFTKDAPKTRWCCNCPKCAFVFLIFAPFVKREELIEVFRENLFEKPELHDTFLELLGKKDIKPFECVGEIEECQEAMKIVSNRWPETKQFL